VSAGWVAGSVRGRLLTRRRLGSAGAREVAAAGAADAAVARLAASPYGREVRVGMRPEAARRAVASVCVWHLRVLAGWLPPRSGDVVRVFAARFELANVADRLVAVRGHRVPEPYALGALDTAWSRVAAASTPPQVQAALAASGWGDPGTAELPDALVPLEARWASWLGAAAPGAADWASAASALVVARRVAAGRPVPAAARADLGHELGRAWESAPDLAGLIRACPRRVDWLFDGIEGAADLWRAEGRFWQRVESDAAGALRAGRVGPRVAAGVAATLVADAWRAQAALEAAGWGPRGVEAFDALA
jgi:hypothetical protein